jgi:branched-chain amino acid aminotransferase
MVIYLNGRFCDAEAPAIRADDRGFTLGDGLFETMRAADGKVLRRDWHLERLRDGAAVLGLTGLPPEGELSDALAATLAENGLADAVLRMTVSRGAAARGLLPPEDISPTVVIAAAPPPPSLPPAIAITATSACRDEASPLSRCKTLNYLPNILARREAEAAGANEALLLNTKGRIAEAAIANLFIVDSGDVVATPPVSEGALPGTMRRAVLEAMACIERALTIEDLATAAEAFLSNSLGIRPLVSLDGKPIGTGEPGPVTKRLQKEFG